MEDYFSADAQFKITHTTISSEFELHKLALKFNCYQLSQSFKEVLSCGRDDQFQLGHQPTFEKFINAKYSHDWSRMPHPFSVASSQAKAVELTQSKDETEILQICAGRQHAACLRKDGSLFTWGVGLSGQLGHTKE